MTVVGVPTLAAHLYTQWQYCDLSDGWPRSKLEFQQFITAIGKGDVTEQVKLVQIAGPWVNYLYETMEFDSEADRGKFYRGVGIAANSSHN